MNVETDLLARPFPTSSAHKESTGQALNLPRVACKRSQRSGAILVLEASPRERERFPSQGATEARMHGHHPYQLTARGTMREDTDMFADVQPWIHAGCPDARVNGNQCKHKKTKSGAVLGMGRAGFYNPTCSFYWEKMDQKKIKNQALKSDQC